MNTFAVLFVCFQACLLQNVYGHCHRGAELIGTAAYAPGFAGMGAYGLGAPYGLELAAPAFAAPLACGAAYGGTGVGDVAVTGEMPVAGTTLVAGQVPILGAVEFGGIVPAAGGVSITGRCDCGCKGGYLY